MVDFLDCDHKIVIDTKYKKKYETEEKYGIDDIRQVSGYARDISLLKKLYGESEDCWKTKIPKCLIIYPKMSEGNKSINPNGLTECPIEEFNEIYKYGIELPTR